MISFIYPLFDLVDNWISSVLPFYLQNLFWGLLAGTLAFIVYFILSNQQSISSIKDEMKKIRKKMFDPDIEEKSEFNSLAKKNLSLSFQLLGKILLPAILSIIPIISIAIWYDTNHSYIFPVEGETITISVFPMNQDLTIIPEGQFIRNNGDILSIQPKNTNEPISFYSNESLIYSGEPFKKPIPIIEKKKWWNFLVSNPNGYLSNNSPIDNIKFNYLEKIQFAKLPSFLNGWELLYFIGIFISAISLRLIFKVQ